VRAYDTVVVGGGLVGMAVAYGLARRGTGVAVVDEGDVAFRAARGNFALVWVHGKGGGFPRYASWTRTSADLWPEFASELKSGTGIDVAYSKRGAVHICFSDEEMVTQRARLELVAAEAEPSNINPGVEFEMLDRSALDELMPGLGPDVVGASFSAIDGHCNSLMLHEALLKGFQDLGGHYLPDHRVFDINPQGSGFLLKIGLDEIACGRVVLAGGIANRWLGPMIGMDVPVKALRGQILVTERLKPLFNIPTSLMRQTDEGTVMLGDTREDVGLDEGTTLPGLRKVAANAVRTFPFLAKARLVRAWAALRPMPEDTFSIYSRSAKHPNAFVVNCHSGVTLAAVHAEHLAAWVAGEDVTPGVDPFSLDRFDVQTAA
jgi:glycine/D-amino acid oxidase-like deaminating enzyme